VNHVIVDANPRPIVVKAQQRNQALWQGVVSTMIELTREYRMAWRVRAAHVSHGEQVWWEAKMEDFIFRIESDDADGVTVEYRGVTYTAACSESTRSTLCRFVARFLDADEVSVARHANVVLDRHRRRD
jgi:hypothetical protein